MCLLCVTLVPFLRISTERKQRMLFCVSCTVSMFAFSGYNYFTVLLATFQDLDRVRTLAVYGGSESSQIPSEIY